MKIEDAVSDFLYEEDDASLIEAFRQVIEAYVSYQKAECDREPTVAALLTEILGALEYTKWQMERSY